MTVAQGLYKTVAYKKQSALGTPATGSGGTQVRRETATFAKTKGNFTSNEILANQQYPGDTYGVSETSGTINGLLSAGNWAPFFASLGRGALSAGVTTTGASLTIAASGQQWTITRAAGSFLTDGYKIGDVVQLTAGAFTGTALNINLLIVGLTATVATVIVPNGSTLSAQGPVASAAMGVVNKKFFVPSTGQANDYYTFEEWYNDVSLSRLYTDTQVASIEVAVPATGNATVKMALLGLSRTKNVTQQLTAPAAAQSTTILTSPNAVIIVNGAQTVIGTSINMKIDGQLKPGESVIGSKTISDLVKGDIKVSGTLTALKQDETYSGLFDNETALPIIVVLFADTTATSDFVSFVIPCAKLFKDEVDDGKKQLVGTYDYVAQYNASGGAGVAYDTGIFSYQDSRA